MSKSKKMFRVIGFMALAFFAYVGFTFVPVAMTMVKAGFLDRTVKHEYVGTAEENLKVISTAMKLYHDSEGAYPKGEKWMDSIVTRLKTNDLKKGEEQKKLRNPMVETDQIYGFAFNSECSEKYIDDLKAKGDTILVFATIEPGRNVSGDPEKLAIKTPEGKYVLAITASGTVVKN